MTVSARLNSDMYLRAARDNNQRINGLYTLQVEQVMAKPLQLLNPFGFFSANLEKLDVRLVSSLKSESINANQTTSQEAIVLPSTDGVIHFYLLQSSDTRSHFLDHMIPRCFKFDFEVKIRAVKIGDLRLFGRAEKP